MKLSIEMKTDNAAFEDDDREVERLLVQVARRIRLGFTELEITDINGKTVGHWSLK
jgi:hypothetical protein